MREKKTKYKRELGKLISIQQILFYKPVQLIVYVLKKNKKTGYALVNLNAQ